MVKIKEIFSSIQGEGPLVGYKQLFIRFCGCNLNCNYCDTDFDYNNAKDYSVEELLKIIEENSDCHSVSLTGGEPLLQTSFLKVLLPKIKLPVYLETNGTLFNELLDIKKYLSYIATDIKLPSCTNLQPLWDEHYKFLQNTIGVQTYIKVVFDENITHEEINIICNYAKEFDLELVLQPKMCGNELSVKPDFFENKFNECFIKYRKVRLIPQVHKFINVI